MEAASFVFVGVLNASKSDKMVLIFYHRLRAHAQKVGRGVFIDSAAGPHRILRNVSSARQAGESTFTCLFRQEQILPSAHSELLQPTSVLEFSSARPGAIPAVNS